MPTTLPPKSIFGIRQSELNGTLRVLDKLGVTTDHFDALRRYEGRNTVAERVGRAFTQNEYQTSMDLRIARAALDSRLIGLGDWNQFLGVLFGSAEEERSLQFPWNEEILNSPCPFFPDRLVKETHTALFGMDHNGVQPFTVSSWLELAHLMGVHLQMGQHETLLGWATALKKTSLSCRWHLLLTDVVPGSNHGVGLANKMHGLPDEYEVPTLVTELTKQIMWIRKFGRPAQTHGWGTEIAGCEEDKNFGMISMHFGNYTHVSLSSHREHHPFIGASRKLPATT